MVDVLGHLGMGLLWAVPAWFVWSGRTPLLSIGFVVFAAPLPDVDRWLNLLAPGLVHHHGVTHTVVFVVVVSALVGVLVAVTLSRAIARWLGEDRFGGRRLFVVAFGAFLWGGLSHLFTDMLSAPDIAQPIEPFWPLLDKPWSVNLIWYDSPLWNVGLLTVAVLVHAAVAYRRRPVARPHS